MSLFFFFLGGEESNFIIITLRKTLEEKNKLYYTKKRLNKIKTCEVSYIFFSLSFDLYLSFLYFSLFLYFFLAFAIIGTGSIVFVEDLSKTEDKKQKMKEKY